MMNVKKFFLSALVVLPTCLVAMDEPVCFACGEPQPLVVLHATPAGAEHHASCINCAKEMFLQHRQCDVYAYRDALARMQERMARGFFGEDEAALSVPAVEPCQQCLQEVGVCERCQHCHRQCPVCRVPLVGDDIRAIRGGGIPIPAAPVAVQEDEALAAPVAVAIVDDSSEVAAIELPPVARDAGLGQREDAEGNIPVRRAGPSVLDEEPVGRQPVLGGSGNQIVPICAGIAVVAIVLAATIYAVRKYGKEDKAKGRSDGCRT